MITQISMRRAAPKPSHRRRTALVVLVVCLLTLCAAPRAQGAPADDMYVLAAGHYARGQWQLAAETFAAFLAQAPAHRRAPQALFYRAEALVQLNDLAGARDVFQAYLLRAPADGYLAQAKFRAAEAAMLLGQHEAAVAEFEQLVVDHPDDKLLAFALAYLGDMTLEQGHVASAEQYYRQALAQFPHGALADDCRLGLARVTLKKDEPDAARKMLNQLAERDAPLADDALLELALLEFSTEHNDQVGAACETLRRRFPNSPLLARAQLTHGWALFRQKKFGEARAQFAALAEHEKYGAESRYWTALCHRSGQDWAQAAAVLQPLLPELDGVRWEESAWFHAGDSLIRAGQTAAGRELLDQAQKRWPNGVWADDGALATMRLALDEGRAEEVLPLADAFAERFPDRLASRHRAQRMRAQAHLALKQFDQAVAVLESLLAQAGASQQQAAPRAADPFSSDGEDQPLDLATDRYLLSVAYAGAGRQVEAAELATEVSDDAASPLGVDAHLIRAAALAAVGKHAEALAPLEAYLAARPTGAEAARCRAEVALCHARAGNMTAARAAFEQLTTKHPAHETLGPTAEQLAELARSGDELAWAEELYTFCAAEDQTEQRRARGLFGQAWCRRQRGELAAARETLKKLLKTWPDATVADDAAVTLGGICEQLDEPEQALAAYDRVIAQAIDCPQRPTALLAAALVHDRLAQDRSAAQRYEKFLTDYPAHPQRESALYQWGWALREDGQQAASEQALAQLRLEFPQGKYALDAAYRLAEQAYEVGAYDAAKELLVELQDSAVDHPLAAHAWYLAGRIAVAQSRWVDVAQAMNKVQSASPEGPLALQAEYWQGEALFRQNEFAAAAEQLAALAEKTRARSEPWLAMVHLRLAQALAHEQKWAEVRVAASGIAQRFPGFEQQHEADYLIGRGLAVAADFEAARRSYQRVLEAPAAAKTETAAQAQLMLAETYFHQRDFNAAVREYLAVEILYAFPDLQAAALWQAGKCYEQLQQPADAASVYRRLTESFPQSPYASQAKQRQTELTAAAPAAPRASR